MGKHIYIPRRDHKYHPRVKHSLREAKQEPGYKDHAKTTQPREVNTKPSFCETNLSEAPKENEL